MEMSTWELNLHVFVLLVLVSAFYVTFNMSVLTNSVGRWWLSFFIALPAAAILGVIAFERIAGASFRQSVFLLSELSLLVGTLVFFFIYVMGKRQAALISFLRRAASFSTKENDP